MASDEMETRFDMASRIDRDDEVLQAFMEESSEHLVTLEESLLQLEEHGSVEDDVINAIFRAAHTIKGTAGLLGLERVARLAHAMENVLGRLRAKEMNASPPVVSSLLQGTDLLRQMLNALDNMDAVDTSAVVAALHAHNSGAPTGAPSSLSEPDHAKGTSSAEIPAEPTDSAHGEEARSTAVALSAGGTVATAPRGDAAPAAATGGRRGEGTGSVRVNLGQLDRLMMLAGELVLTRNALIKKASERDLEEMINLTQRVDAITSELQDGIMATRMQQVGIVFTKFKRLVRDLAQALGKKIDLAIEGEEVELDKTIIEAIGDPLTHLVRNSADHGIELPAKRVAAGKRETGRLQLRAFHEAGQVVIEVIDDGGGIDPARVAAKALEKGLFSREQLAGMTTEQKIRLIFEPGFSTAAEVTDVSGRGVGMDVVLSSLTKVGGTVDIRSDVGRGTTTTIRLPLTLAIIPSILVAVGNERFAIPQVNLVELVRIPAAEVQRRIERVGSATVMRLRGDLLPLLRMHELLGAEPVYADPATGAIQSDRRLRGYDRRSADLEQPTPEAADERRRGEERRRIGGVVHVAVVASGAFRFGLIVDQLLDSEEIVVKPLGAHLASCQEYAGATILGDGAVALILDIAGISNVAQLSSAKSAIDAVEARRRAGLAAPDVQPLLIVENGPGEQFVIPLGFVARIERIREDSILTIGGRRTITQGETMMALLAIEDVAKVGPRVPSALCYAVVCKVWGREVGILTSRIVDIVDSGAPVDPSTHTQPGILGSTVIHGGVMLLLDVHSLVDALLPEYKKPKPIQSGESPTVLVVEDSPFFRKQMIACLTEAGMTTLSAEDGEQGLVTLCEHADRVRLIITDIEMPKMDGLEMTRRIRADARFAALPIVACTSVSGAAAEKRGRDAGLTEYLVKLDRDQIVERSNHYLRRGQAGVA